MAFDIVMPAKIRADETMRTLRYCYDIIAADVKSDMAILVAFMELESRVAKKRATMLRNDPTPNGTLLWGNEADSVLPFQAPQFMHTYEAFCDKHFHAMRDVTHEVRATRHRVCPARAYRCAHRAAAPVDLQVMYWPLMFLARRACRAYRESLGERRCAWRLCKKWSAKGAFPACAACGAVNYCSKVRATQCRYFVFCARASLQLTAINNPFVAANL